MRARHTGLAVLASLGALVSWFFLQNFKLTGLDNVQLQPKNASSQVNSPLPVKRTSETIRIASFNIQVFGESKLAKPEVMDVLAKIVRNFDIVAVQEVRAKSDDVLPRFVELINSAGRQYDYVIGHRLGRTVSKEQYAYIFDRQSVEVDRAQVYTVGDPDDLLHREPLVAWFRVRGPAPNQAFTFSLVNMHTDPDLAQEETNVLGGVMQMVRADGRREDDVILLGDLNVDSRHLGRLAQTPGIAAAISGVPTNTRRTQHYDHIIFFGDATREFTGRAGVFDFMREYNLTMDQALAVSDHMPVWAEFSIYEGGIPGQVANRPEGNPR